MDYRPERSWRKWFDDRVLAKHAERNRPSVTGFAIEHPRPLRDIG